MSDQTLSLDSFKTFGDLLKYLRRRERLTQLELSIKVGYSEAQIGRLEKNQRRPDLTALKALFIPALHLEEEPELMARFLELAQSSRQEDAPAPGIAPYKGLLFFDESDAGLFFGREALTAHLAERVSDLSLDSSLRLLAVVGASGSGKSSLVRAGLAVTLEQAGWDVRIFTPSADPCRALEAQLELHHSMAESKQLLLLVDQFEETFTLCRNESERAAFIEGLLSLAQDPSQKTAVVIALRADFYSHCAQYPLLREAVAARQEYIGQMTALELRHAIEEPARRGGWELESGLVDVLLIDIGAQDNSEPEPGALPLLSHALLATWERRRGRTLTLEGYRASGGVQSAIAETAESVFTDQLNQTQQELARDVFLRLTELGEGTEDTRRRAALNELVAQSAEAPQLRGVLNTLAEARLITLNEDSAEVSHEALIREWQRLRQWLTQDRKGLLLHRHLTESAHDWERRGHDPADLYRGARLAQVREWASANEERLNAEERSFLETSFEQEQHDALEREEARQRELATAKELAESQRQSALRLRIRNRVITTVGSIAVILALLAGTFGVQSNRNANTAQNNAATAQIAKDDALNAKAAAQDEAQARATQQSIAETNFQRAEAQRLAAEATKLLLSHGNSDVIALLSLRSMNTQYTSQGDAALVGAAGLDYPLGIFKGHEDEITGIAFSPDGKYLLTCSVDKTVRLWDVATRQEVRQFVGHSDVVYRVIFSPDGKYILTGSIDKTARLWETATGKEVRQFIGHTDAVTSVAFSPDGKYVLTGSRDKTARLWDSATAQELRQFIGHTTIVVSATFSPDGKYILTGSSDKTARLWNTTTSQEVRQFIGHLATVVSVAFSPNGKFIATGSDDNTVRLWDSATGQELRQFIGHTNPVKAVVFSPEGKYLVSASDDRTARLWDVQTGQEVRRFLGHLISVKNVAFSADGKYVATAGSDGRALLWSVKPRPELPLLDNTSAINGVAFSRDGKFALTGGGDGIARLWNVSTGQELRDFKGHTAVINWDVAFSPDDKYIVTGAWDKTVRLWDAETGKQLRQFNTTGDVNSVTFSPDGKYILAGSSGDNTAWLWVASTGEEVRRFIAPTSIWRVVFSPDGKLIATASQDGNQLWDVATGQEVFQFGSKLMTSVMFSPDGKYILSGNVVDKTAQLWDAVTGREVRQFIGDTDGVWTAVFSPDGKYIATASADGTARLWDPQTGQELRRFIGHAAGIEDVIFSPDGKYILTGSDDGTARLWDVDYHTTMQYLCSILWRDFTDEERQEYDIKDTTATCPTS